MSEKIVVVPLTPERAEALRGALCDIHCWLSGWLAAKPDDDLRYSFLHDAVRATRNFNADLTDAIHRQET